MRYDVREWWYGCHKEAKPASEYVEIMLKRNAPVAHASEPDHSDEGNGNPSVQIGPERDGCV